MVSEIKEIISKVKNGAVQKLKASNLLDEVISLTSFLDKSYTDISWAQRFWHIRNDKFELIKCKNPECNNITNFVIRDARYFGCCGEECGTLYAKNIGENNWRKQFIKNLPDNYKFIAFEYNLRKLKHTTCNKGFEINKELYKLRKKRGVEICLHCNPIKKSWSIKEKEVVDYVKSIYNDKIVENSRQIINPYELDVYLPKLKIAIEFNGTYSHADPRFYKANHKIRYKTAQEIWERDELKNLICINSKIQLITVWEYDWINNCEIIKQSLKDSINGS